MKIIALFLFTTLISLVSYSQQENIEKKVEGKVQNAKKIEVWPQYPGGEDSLIRFLAKNIRYPSICLENEITGQILASFVVCEDGSLCDLKISRSKHREFDNEVLRIMKKMKNWTPGTIDGKPVKVYFDIPINFESEDQSSIRPDTLKLNFEEINEANFLDWAKVKELKLRIRAETILKIHTKEEYLEKLANANPFDSGDHIYLFDIELISNSKNKVFLKKEIDIKVKTKKDEDE